MDEIKLVDRLLDRPPQEHPVEHVKALLDATVAIRELYEALEHVTELLVDTWRHKMDGDPEKQMAVADARAILAMIESDDFSEAHDDDMPTEH